jgi:nitrogen fixation NifU-like protein
MDEEALYQEIILDHHRHPRRRGELDAPTAKAVLDNPFCADRIHLALTVEEGRIAAIHQNTQGCALSRASASLMAETVAGMTLAEVAALEARLRAMLSKDEQPVSLEEWGELAALSGVHRFPQRLPCALLAWNALNQAIDPEYKPAWH